MELPVYLVDVFAESPFTGNPLAVVVASAAAEAELSDSDMQRVANWLNFSETTFLFESDNADYRVRIFTPSVELPFAGHPTLGTAWVWRSRQESATTSTVTQECGVGLVQLTVDGNRLSFRAPPMIRSGPVDPEDLDRFAQQLNIDRQTIVDASWVDNGPGWVGLLLPDAQSVLDIEPGPIDAKLGLVGPYVGVAGPHTGDDIAAAIEVRAFFPAGGSLSEDPATGSLNASLAQWLIGSGRLQAPYVATQGTRLARSGIIRVSTDDQGDVWVGGSVVPAITGQITVTV